MLKRFIERPVLATVISILLVLLGTIGLFTLPITQFPEIAPPSVLVSAVYPGASAEVVARAVATPLEEAINGVEGMTYMTSTASNDGSLAITIFFKLGTNPDQAAVNVQNRVSQATSQMPAEVLQTGISTQKQQAGITMFVNIYSDKPEFDEKFLQNYTKINIIPEIKRVPGVGNATVFGNKDYSMRVWLNPSKLAAYNMTPQDVLAAIKDQNVEAAPGSFGADTKEAFEYVIRYKGKLNEQAQYEDIILRANADGSILRLKDIARVEFGSFTYNGNSRMNGLNTTGFAVFQTAGSNANDVQTQVYALLKKVGASFPPGVKYEVNYSTKDFLDASISQVQHTLLEAFILVFIVVYIFLQDLRSTLIPAIAVPVAIIGTFFFMGLFGFSINLLTLFALVLAIGIVVDDAIVVVEAVHSKMERTGLSPRAATVETMSEITGAIISITLVMSAVFLPVGFMKGPAGIFYQQFAFTLAIAIVISAVNALTLSPALCALFLKEVHHEGNEKKTFKEKFFTGFNAGFNGLTSRYVKALHFLLKSKWVAVVGLIVITLATAFMIKTTPSGFIPTEDQGFVIAALSMPPGASLDRTNKIMAEADSVLHTVSAVKNVIAIAGFNLLSSSNSPSAAVAFIKLKPLHDRGKVKDLNAVMGEINGKLSGLKDGSFFAFTFPTVPGFGNINGFELVLQDRTGGSLDKFNKVSQEFMGKLMARKEIAVAFSTFNPGYPQYQMEVDKVKAKQLGVNVSDLIGTLQAFYGSYIASDFNRFGKFYRVVVQADAPFRTDLASLNGIFVRNGTGEMVPVNSIITMKRVYGPETVNHFNLFTSITVNGQPKPGFSSGDAIKAVQEIAKTDLPTGYTYEWTGMTREEISSGSQSIIIFSLCLVFVYFLLAAQYESYILPFAVILSIPLGIFGVFIFINLAGIENNIYVQVGLIMLIGLLAKNAILIVEFALQRRKAGQSLGKAAVEGAKLRLRPILMTSLAFIVGLIPLMSATGASAIGNHSISTGAAGGMFTGVVFGVLAIPVLFVMFQFLHEKISGEPKAPIDIPEQP